MTSIDQKSVEREPPAVVRQSRYTLIVKVTRKDAEHVHAKIRQRLCELAADRRYSITFDQGTEFACCGRPERHLGIALSYADPGCPYQCGTNENTKGLIRQYFPKGTNYQTVSHCQTGSHAAVREVEEWINHRPRACLGYRTPHEVFHEQQPH